MRLRCCCCCCRQPNHPWPGHSVGAWPARSPPLWYHAGQPPAVTVKHDHLLTPIHHPSRLRWPPFKLLVLLWLAAAEHSCGACYHHQPAVAAPHAQPPAGGGLSKGGQLAPRHHIIALLSSPPSRSSAMQWPTPFEEPGSCYQAAVALQVPPSWCSCHAAAATLRCCHAATATTGFEELPWQLLADSYYSYVGCCHCALTTTPWGGAARWAAAV
jgi:hypothetical protein